MVVPCKNYIHPPQLSGKCQRLMLGHTVPFQIKFRLPKPRMQQQHHNIRHIISSDFIHNPLHNPNRRKKLQPIPQTRGNPHWCTWIGQSYHSHPYTSPFKYMIRCKTASACSRQHHICPQYRNPRVCQPLLHRLQHLRPGLKIMVTRHNCIYSKALRHFGVYMLSCPLPYLPVAQAHRYISLQIVTTIQKEDVVGMKGRPPPLQISTGIC